MTWSSDKPNGDEMTSLFIMSLLRLNQLKLSIMIISSAFIGPIEVTLPFNGFEIRSILRDWYSMVSPNWTYAFKSCSDEVPSINGSDLDPNPSPEPLLLYCLKSAVRSIGRLRCCNQRDIRHSIV